MWNYAQSNGLYNSTKSLTVNNVKQEYDRELDNNQAYDEVSIVNSDELINKEIMHDIYQIIPKEVIKTETNGEQVINTQQEQVISDLLTIIHEEIKDISANNMSDLMRPTSTDPDYVAYTHEIVIKPDTEPIKQKVRKIPYSFASEFRTLIDEMKRAGMIVDSYSPWCSPVRLVRKKDGTVRICVDFRKLNSVTVKDAYPIPIINDLFVHLAKAKVFSTLDLKSGYFQVQMKQESQSLTAFACEFGFYEYKVMPMGLLIKLYQRVCYVSTINEHCSRWSIRRDLCCIFRRYNYIFRKRIGPC